MGSSAERERLYKLTACICPEYELLTASDLKCMMNRVKRQLLENDVDLDHPCSTSPSTVCWLLDALCPCNAILYKGGLGLCEEELGCLTCKTHKVPKSSEVFGNEGAILEAAYLLYRLSEQHRCLQRLVVKVPYPLQDTSYWSALLKLALHDSEGLRYVDVISSPDEDGKCCVLDATPTAATVQEIRCSISLSHEDALSRILRSNGNVLTKLVLGYPTRIPTTGCLFSHLRFCISLTRLELNVLEVDVVIFIDFMINNKTITHLSLSQVFPTTVNLGEGVAYLLRVNTTLKVLQLRLRGGDATLIANSMCTNTALRSLSLNGFENLAISSMAEMVILNDTLLELHLSAQNLHVDTTELAGAILFNVTLQKLFIRTSDLGSMTVLVGALKHNSTLLSLDVGAHHVSPCEQTHFRVAALTPLTLGRVVTDWDGELCLKLAHALNCGAAPTSIDIWYSLGEHSPTFSKLGNVCDSLRKNRSVRSLRLCIVPPHEMNESVCQRLRAALRENKTLETLDLFFMDTADGRISKIVCEGIGGSSTIRCLKITVRANAPVVLKYLAAVLENNRVLTSIRINVKSLLDRCHIYAPLSLMNEWTEGWTILSRAIEANRDILEAYVSVKGRCAIDLASDFTLTVLQNICALQQAVRFVLKPNMSKRSAEMFQRYENSRELFRRVERSDEASSWGTYNLILSAAEFIGCYFFVVAEIVKGTLQCEQTSTTAAQLDDLNGVCVLKIVSFLRISDVRS